MKLGTIVTVSGSMLSDKMTSGVRREESAWPLKFDLEMIQIVNLFGMDYYTIHNTQ